MTIMHVAGPVKLMAVSVFASSSALIAMEFSPSEVTTITIAVGALITAIFTGVVNIIVAMQGKAAAADNKTAIAENTKLTEATSVDVSAVKINVDGMKTQDKSKIAEQDRLLVSKDQVINELKQQMAVLLAQARAPQTVVIASPSPESKVDDVKGQP